MVDNVLVSWIGEADLQSSEANLPASGPISATLSAVAFDKVILLCSYSALRRSPYIEWLSQQTKVVIECHQETLVSPVHFESIYLAADKRLESITSQHAKVSILLSPGTPAMQAVWILLGKTKYAATFYQSSKE